MMGRVIVQVQGFEDDHADAQYACLDPIYTVLTGLVDDGLLYDYNWTGGGPQRDRPLSSDEDPRYEFSITLTKGRESEMRTIRARIERPTPDYPDAILSVEVD